MDWKKYRKLILLILALCFFVLILIGAIRFGSFFAFLMVFPWIGGKITAITGMNVWLANLLAVPLAIFMIVAVSLLFSFNGKKRNTGMIMFAGGMCLWYLAMFTITKDLNFNPDGTAQKCVAQNIDGYYEEVSCGFKVNNFGYPVIPKTKEIIIQMHNQKKGPVLVKRILPNKDFSFFAPDGSPLYWYYQHPNGNLEFFDRPGKHPQMADVVLAPINTQVVQTFFRYMEKNESEKVIVNLPRRSGGGSETKETPELRGLIDLRNALSEIKVNN